MDSEATGCDGKRENGHKIMICAEGGCGEVGGGEDGRWWDWDAVCAVKVDMKEKSRYVAVGRSQCHCEEVSASHVRCSLVQYIR